MPPGDAPETTCGSLLDKLQKIWDEIGESDIEKDKMLFELEQECLSIYRRKVEEASKYKANLHYTYAEAEAEASSIISALGEQPNISWATEVKGTLSEQVFDMKRALDGLRNKKDQRVKEFSSVQLQIVRLRDEIDGKMALDSNFVPHVDERHLTVTRLEDMRHDLLELQKEKARRLQKLNQLIELIRKLSVILFVDPDNLVIDLPPGIAYTSDATSSRSISDETIQKLVVIVNSLTEEKKMRLQKVQDLGSTLVELWNLMNTPADEQKCFYHVTDLISASVDEVKAQGCLSLDIIEQAESEAERLNVLKVSKMKELVLAKQHELEQIYQEVHLDFESHAADQLLYTIDCGNFDPSELLSSMDDKIAKAKLEALNRKDILDKAEKWKYAAEEEIWLENYEKDENRFSASKGAHKNLKRAEKARLLVSKLPSLVENLKIKVKAWEGEFGMPFMYDKEELLVTLEEYASLCQEKEDEKRRIWEQKRLQDQLATKLEVLYGSKRTLTTKKPLVTSTASNIGGSPTNRRVKSSLGGEQTSLVRARRGKILEEKVYLLYVQDNSRGKKGKTSARGRFEVQGGRIQRSREKVV